MKENISLFFTYIGPFVASFSFILAAYKQVNDTRDRIIEIAADDPDLSRHLFWFDWLCLQFGVVFVILLFSIISLKMYLGFDLVNQHTLYITIAGSTVLLFGMLVIHLFTGYCDLRLLIERIYLQRTN